MISRGWMVDDKSGPLIALTACKQLSRWRADCSGKQSSVFIVSCLVVCWQVNVMSPLGTPQWWYIMVPIPTHYSIQTSEHSFTFHACSFQQKQTSDRSSVAIPEVRGEAGIDINPQFLCFLPPSPIPFHWGPHHPLFPLPIPPHSLILPLLI